MQWSSVAAQWCCNMISPSLLPLATLGNATQIGPFLFVSCHPSTVACCCCRSYHAKLCQCKIHAVKLSSSTVMLQHDITLLSALGHLGQSDIDRIISICVMSPKVAMASTFAYCCCWCYRAKLCKWKYIQWSSAATLSLQQWKPSSYLFLTKEVFFALFIRLFVEKIGAGILHKLNWRFNIILIG